MIIKSISQMTNDMSHYCSISQIVQKCFAKSTVTVRCMAVNLFLPLDQLVQYFWTN